MKRELWMDKQIKELQDQIKPEHMDIAKYTQHVLEAIDRLIDELPSIVASNALGKGWWIHGITHLVTKDNIGLFCIIFTD
jgi:hypothetical protein